MDNVQLCYVLDLGRCQCGHVGTCIVNARGRIVLVRFPPLSTEVVCSPFNGARRRQILPAIVLGNIIMGTILVLSGTIGARLHISFPVLNRSSFGFWLSYFSVISRVVLSLFLFGIQTTIGSECVHQVWFCSYYPFASIL